MSDEIKQAAEEAAAQVEQAPAVAEAAQPAAAAQAAGKEEDPLVAEVKATVKDVVDQVEKLPVTQKVKEVAKDVAEEVEKRPMAARVIERVKGAADEVDRSPLAAQVRKAMQETAESIEKSPLLGVAHKVLLAGIGAVALAQEEIEDFINRLVERGQIAEADGKKMLKDVLEKRKSVLEKKTAEQGEAPKRAADEMEKRVEDALTRMNIPSKDEIEALSAKVTALTRKVEELKKQA